MHSPRVASSRPSLWEEQSPKGGSRRVDPMQWFSDNSLSLAGIGGSMQQLKPPSQSSPRGAPSSLPRSYTTLQRAASPATAVRRDLLLRPPSPSTTNRRIGTPYQTRAQTPRNHHQPPPPPPASIHSAALRAKTPTRVEASFLAAASVPSERTPLRYDFPSTDSAPSPIVAGRSYYHRNRASAEAGVLPTTAISVDSYSSAGLTETSVDSDSYFSGEPSLRKFTHSSQEVPQSPPAALTASQLLAALAHRRSTEYSPPRQSQSSIVLQESKGIHRSAAPTLSSLHSPRSVVPNPATPTLFRRVDSEVGMASPSSSGLMRAVSDGHILSGAQRQFQRVDTSPIVGDDSNTRKETPSSRGTARSQLRALVSSWENRYKENSKCYREGGYLTITKGDLLNQRYEMMHKLGWGEFSTVWLARDQRPVHPHHTFVAVKVAKCHPNVTASTNYEINLLRYICSSAKMSGAPITRLLDTFEHEGPYGVHQCMVMPVMGSNLLCVVDQMKGKKRRRSEKELSMFKEVAAATLRALDSLESINVVHTDIKPENVLLSVPDPKMVKLAASCCTASDNSALTSFELGDTNGPVVAVADFGLSFLLEHPSYMPTGAEKVGIKKDLDVQYPGIANNKKGILIQTREYRAPEVLFGGALCPRSDIWSVGCMIYELITGEFLLDPKQKTAIERDMDVEHVAMIMRILGPVPPHIAKSSQNPARHLSRYFDADGRFLYADKYKNLPRRSIAAELESFLEPAEAERAAQFIMSCFTYDPLERCHARDLLNHSWLRSTRL